MGFKHEAKDIMEYTQECVDRIASDIESLEEKLEEIQEQFTNLRDDYYEAMSLHECPSEFGGHELYYEGLIPYNIQTLLNRTLDMYETIEGIESYVRNQLDSIDERLDKVTAHFDKIDRIGEVVVAIAKTLGIEIPSDPTDASPEEVILTYTQNNADEE